MKVPAAHSLLNLPGTILFPIPITAKNCEKKAINRKRKISMNLSLAITYFIKVTSQVSEVMILMKKRVLMMEHRMMPIIMTLRLVANGSSSTKLMTMNATPAQI